MSKANQKKRRPTRDLIALTLVPKLGASRIRLLLQVVDHPQDVFRLSKKNLKKIEGIGPILADTIPKFNRWDEVDDILQLTEDASARIISCLDDEYPAMLREIYDPPLMLWVKGDPAVLNSNSIAMVGTRRATRYGLKMAEYFAGGLVDNELTIISGLAYGIDAASHRTTIKAGGKTIAVLGSGIDKIYPWDHTDLVHKIVQTGGAVITEYRPGMIPEPGNFPERNRIVSGLALGTLVVESGLKGGSMITARSALDQNREVFAIPHSLKNSNGEGCNAIIKRGWGKLVQEVDDIMVEIPVYVQNSKKEKKSLKSDWKSLDLDELSVSICRRLEKEKLHIDELSETLGLPPQKLLPKLLELEMQDCIRQTAGKNFELK